MVFSLQQQHQQQELNDQLRDNNAMITIGGLDDGKWYPPDEGRNIIKGSPDTMWYFVVISIEKLCCDKDHIGIAG